MNVRIGHALVALAVAALTLFVTQCARTPSSTSADVYKLGLDLPLSGIDGAASIPARNAVELAIDVENRRGFPSGARVVLADLDDSIQGKHDPAQGAANVRAFVADPAVFAIVGPMNSNVAKAEIPVGNAGFLPEISMGASSIELTRLPAAAALRPTHPDVPTFFRVCASDDRQGTAIAIFARAHGFRRIFVIDDNESYGRGLADVFVRAFPAVGGTILGREHLTAFALDYQALLTKVRTTSPDAVFFGGIVSTGGGILRKQMIDVGLGHVAYLGGDGLASPQYVPLAGAAADNTYFSLLSPDIEHLPAAAGFRHDYRKRFGTEPGTYSAGAYAAAIVAGDALRTVLAARSNAGGAAGVDRRAVVAAIAAGRVDGTPIGVVDFDRYGDIRRPVISLYRIGHGAIRFVATVAPNGIASQIGPAARSTEQQRHIQRSGGSQTSIDGPKRGVSS